MATKYRRSRFLLFTIEELEQSGDLHSFLVITSVISGQHLLSTQHEIESLRQVSDTEWVKAGDLLELGFASRRVAEMARFGILHEDPGTLEQRLWLSREEILKETHWPACAAAFHLLNHYQESSNTPFSSVIDMSLREREAKDRAAQFLKAHGLPPSEFYEKDSALQVENLPLEVKPTGFVETLLKRRTSRHFVPGGSVAAQDLAQLLRLSLGPWGLRRLTSEVSLLLKTSASGGSLHPMEGFPIIFRCGGFKSGVYHYRTGQHALALLQEQAEADLRRLSIYLAQGQDFVGACSFLVVLVARFDRNFWKYRERENSYAVVLQDAGHLSQTFQLVASDLGLGSFYTAAINSEAITELLNLRFPAEAPIGILGFGVSEAEATEELPIEVFLPRR